MISFDWTLHRDRLLTANQRLHWAVRARKTRELRVLAYWAAKGRPPMDQARAICELTFRDRRRRDAANWHPTAKALIDGCVDAGLLPDDDSQHLVGPDMRITDPDPTLRPGQVRVSLIFEEMP